MKKRIFAVILLIAYIIFTVWFTIKDLPKKENQAEKNSVETTENAASE